MLPVYEKFVALCQPVNLLYWHFGARVTDANRKRMHNETLHKISVIQWFLKEPSARMGMDLEQHWIQIKSQSGGSFSLLGSSGSTDSRRRERKEAELSDTDTEGGDNLEFGLDLWTSDMEWTEDEIKEAWGTGMNSTAKCMNCGMANSHSAPWCNQRRKNDLPCQLCLLFSHAKKDCMGPANVSSRRWKRHVRDKFFVKIGNKRKPAGGGGGGPGGGLPDVQE